MVQRAVALSGLVGAAFSFRAEQEQQTNAPPGGFSGTVWDTGDFNVGDHVGRRQWVCGNTFNVEGGVQTGAAINPKAGIQQLRGPLGTRTLNWLKEVDWDHLTVAERQSAWYQTEWDQLFCASYVGKYRNPRVGAANFAGVCIRDNTPGYKWRSVVQVDREVKAAWEYFGNVRGSTVTPLTAEQGGYQKSNAQHKVSNQTSFNYQWGSGGFGNVPSNWCAEYMREFLCHIAFPQYAGPAPADADAWGTGNTPTQESATSAQMTAGEMLVRPTCYAFCESIMDNCNRAEPDSGDIAWPWLQPNYAQDSSSLLSGRLYQNLTIKLDNGETVPNPVPAYPIRNVSEENSFWCDTWNRGFHLAQAGTGTGKGGDEDVDGPSDSKRFCAEWSASASVVPAIATLVIAAVAAML